MLKKLTSAAVLSALTIVNVNANDSEIISIINQGLKKIETPSDAPDWLKRTSIDIEVEENYKPKWELETVQPIYQFSKEDMVFWQFNAHTRDSEETVNLGLGYRNIITADVMLGINSFYDYQFDDKHKRWSIGVEAIGQKYEFRANRYMAISNKVEVETNVYEQALDGWDVEVGGQLIPEFDLRTYAKYSVWEGVTTNDLKQSSARFEYPLNDSMDFELAYTHDNKQQGHFDQNRISAQLVITLGAKSKSSKNLESSENLYDKLLIPIKRENEIIVERTVLAQITIGRGN